MQVYNIKFKDYIKYISRWVHLYCIEEGSSRGRDLSSASSVIGPGTVFFCFSTGKQVVLLMHDTLPQANHSSSGPFFVDVLEAFARSAS